LFVAILIDHLTLNDLEWLVKFLVHKQTILVLPTPLNQVRYLSK